MTTPSRGRVIECPVCLSDFGWDDAPLLVADSANALVAVDWSSLPPSTNREAMLARAYRTCPGTQVTGPHNLPERYLRYDTEPVRIGLVGGPGTGKSHLLAAMIHQATDTSLMRPYGLSARGLDLVQFLTYRDTVITPLIRHRLQLPVTRTATVNLTVGLEVTATEGASRRTHAVVFFDVAGERLQRSGPESDFINGLNALLCVVDPAHVRGLALRSDAGRSAAGGDVAVETVLERLRQTRAASGDPFLPLPCALVVTKSDLLRHRGFHEVERWLTESSAAAADLSTVEQESADVYAMLAARCDSSWLRPALECEDSTLHLASPTGTASDPVPGEDGELRFPERAFRQQRVLRPLLALLAMKGVVSERAVGRLGRGGVAR